METKRVNELLNGLEDEIACEIDKKIIPKEPKRVFLSEPDLYPEQQMFWSLSEAEIFLRKAAKDYTKYTGIFQVQFIYNDGKALDFEVENNVFLPIREDFLKLEANYSLQKQGWDDAYRFDLPIEVIRQNKKVDCLQEINFYEIDTIDEAYKKFFRIELANTKRFTYPKPRRLNLNVVDCIIIKKLLKAGFCEKDIKDTVSKMSLWNNDPNYVCKMIESVMLRLRKRPSFCPTLPATKNLEEFLVYSGEIYPDMPVALKNFLYFIEPKKNISNRPVFLKATIWLVSTMFSRDGRYHKFQECRKQYGSRIRFRLRVIKRIIVKPVKDAVKNSTSGR